MARSELGTEHLWWGRMGVCCRQILCLQDDESGTVVGASLGTKCGVML